MRFHTSTPLFSSQLVSSSFLSPYTMNELFLMLLFKKAVASLQSTSAAQKSKHCWLFEYSILHRAMRTFWRGSRSRPSARGRQMRFLNAAWPPRARRCRSRGARTSAIRRRWPAATSGRTSARGSGSACRCAWRPTVQFSSNFFRGGADLD